MDAEGLRIREAHNRGLYSYHGILPSAILIHGKESCGGAIHRFTMTWRCRLPSQADAAGVTSLSQTPQQEDLHDLIHDYMPLVRHVVNRVVVGSSGSSILQYEDMVSCGV